MRTSGRREPYPDASFSLNETPYVPFVDLSPDTSRHLAGMPDSRGHLLSPTSEGALPHLIFYDNRRFQNNGAGRARPCGAGSELVEGRERASAALRELAESQANHLEKKAVFARPAKTRMQSGLRVQAWLVLLPLLLSNGKFLFKSSLRRP